MTTTDFFDFSFVDRHNETKVWNKFINEDPECILWIDGKRGVGKRTFVINSAKRCQGYELVFYDINKDLPPAANLENLMHEVDKNTQKSFLSSLESHFTGFYNIFGGVSKTLASVISPDKGILYSLLLDTAYLLTNSDAKKYETSEVVGRYLRDAFAEKNIILCIANFSSCDNNLAEFLFRTFNILKTDSLCHIVIITESEDVNTEKEYDIQKSIPIQRLSIQALQKHRYFYEILSPIFDMGEYDDDDIKYIHKKCLGEPQRLSKLISILLSNGGIKYDFESTSKPQINKSILYNILKKEHIRFQEDTFSILQRIIIYAFASLYDGVTIKDLKRLILYLGERIELAKNFTETLFYEELQKLIEKHFLESDGERVYVHADSDYIDFQDMFLSSNMSPLISENVYVFLIRHPSLNNQQEIILRNMKNGHVLGWEKYGYDLGYTLFLKKDYFNAEKMFAYLHSSYHLLSDEQKMILALNAMETGDFKFANIVFSDISVEELKDNSMKCEYFYNYGKCIYNSIGDLTSAISKIEKALIYAKDDIPQCAKIKNTLQMFWWETPNGFDTAKQYFEDIRFHYKDTCPNVWANAIRGCHNYIFDKETALHLLEEALTYAADDLERAFIKTSIGYVYFRDGDVENAARFFQKSYEETLHIKRYESIYPANDLAICYMLGDSNDDYIQALELLEESFYWCRTNYGRLVLRTHMMICNMFLGKRIEALHLAKELDAYINECKPIDPVIIRKINLNLSIVYKEFDDIEKFNQCKSNLEGYIDGTSSEYRYRVVFNHTEETPPANPYRGCSTFDPWLIVFAHD